VTETDYRQYDAALGRFNVMDILSEMAPDHTPYRYGFNNPVYFSDATGLFESYGAAQQWIDTWGLSNANIRYNWNKNHYEIENDGVSFYQQGEDIISTMYSWSDSDGITMSFNTIKGAAGGGNQEYTWRDQLSADFTNSYSSSGLRYFVDWWKYNDFAGGVGGYIVNGYGGYNLGGRKDIKGKHKTINATDMAGPGAGGAATTQGTILHVLQYLNGAFSIFSKENNYDVIRENEDTIFYRIPLRSGFYTTAWKVKNDTVK